MVFEHTPTLSKRPRVVMAGPTPPAIGGMVTVLEDLLASRLAHDADLVLFDTKKSTPEGRSLLQAVAARISLWGRWWNALKGPNTIAHIHTCSGLTFFLDGALLLLAKARGVPVLLHIHGGLFEQFLRSLSPLALGVARLIARSANHVLVLSEGWRTLLSPLLRGARIAVVENGIALPSRVVERSDSEVPTILFLGNVSIAKGLEDLIDACARLNHPFRLVVVGGEEPPGIAVRLTSRAAALDIAERMVFVGPVHGPRKYDYLGSADIFVLPSHAEALPMSLLEAMAYGLAVVVSRVGAVPSVVEDGLNGLLVEPRDVPGLAASLERLLQDAGMRSRMGREARRVAYERYSVDRTANELMAIYLKVAV